MREKAKRPKRRKSRKSSFGKVDAVVLSVATRLGNRRAVVSAIPRTTAKTQHTPAKVWRTFSMKATSKNWFELSALDFRYVLFVRTRTRKLYCK